MEAAGGGGGVSAKTRPRIPGMWRLSDSSQIELLKELLDLQKDMVVMLLSLLEGKCPVSGGSKVQPSLKMAIWASGAPPSNPV